MVRYTEVQLYIDFTLTVPTSNPTVPTEWETVRERTWERGLGLRNFSCVVFVSRNPTPKYPAARERKPLVTQYRVPNYPGYFTLNSTKQSGGARL